MWVFILGCSNSGLDLGSTTGDSGGGGPSGLQDCPWVGDWELETIKCGTFTLDDWYDFHDGASMEIAHDPAGGCAVVATVRGAACRRNEDWHFALPAGVDVALTSAGITECIPAGCQYEPASDPCANGSLAGDFSVKIEDINGTLNASNLLVDTAEDCPLDIVTTWKPDTDG